MMQETKTSHEEMQDEDDLSEAKPDTSFRSPVAALNELIAALGSLPPSTEEVIAKLKNQVHYLIQVSLKNCTHWENSVF